MKRLFLFLAVLLVACPAIAATVTGTLLDSSEQPLQSRITFSAVHPPTSVPPNTIIARRVVITNATDGTFSVVLASANYEVTINSPTVANLANQFSIFVPASGTWNISDLVGTVGELYNPRITIQEVDGSPIVSGVTNIIVSNGTLTSNGVHSVTITTGGGGAGLDDGDKGDITVSGSGTVWTIDAGVVSDAKLAAGINANKIAAGTVSDTEFGHLAGATANIQNQLDGLAGAGVADGDKGDITVSGSGTVWTVDSGLPANRISSGTVSNTEFNYLDGVTSPIQTQLGTKITSGAGAIVNADVNASAAIAASKLDLTDIATLESRQFLLRSNSVSSLHVGLQASGEIVRITNAASGSIYVQKGNAGVNVGGGSAQLTAGEVVLTLSQDNIATLDGDAGFIFGVNGDTEVAGSIVAASVNTGSITATNRVHIDAVDSFGSKFLVTTPDNATAAVLELANNDQSVGWAFQKAGSGLLQDLFISDTQHGNVAIRANTNGWVRIGGPAAPTTALDVSGTATATAFVGDGSGLTALNASQLTSGTVPDARFPATLPAASGANLTALRGSQVDSSTVPSLTYLRSNFQGIDLGDVSGPVSVSWSTNGIKLRMVGDTDLTVTGSPPAAGFWQTAGILAVQDDAGSRALTINGTAMSVNSAADSPTLLTVTAVNGTQVVLPLSTVGAVGSGETNVINSVDDEDFQIVDRQLLINGAIGSGGLVRESAAVVYQVSATAISSNATAFTLWSTNINTNLLFSASAEDAFAGGATNRAGWANKIRGFRTDGSAALFNSTYESQILPGTQGTNYTAGWEGLHTNLWWALDSNTLRLRAIGLADEPMNWSVQGFFRQMELAAPAPASDPNRLFYSNFEDSTDRAQWATVPSGWSDAYNTSPAPLFGSFSATSTPDGTSTTHWSSEVDIGNTTGVVYARVAFQIITPTSPTAERIRLSLLDASGNTVARAALRWDGSNYYRIYAGNNAAEGFAAPGSPVATLTGGTYYLQLVYTRGTSVVATLRDASNNVVSGYTRTESIATNETVDEVRVSHRYSNRHIYDSVEVRLDDSWTTP